MNRGAWRATIHRVTKSQIEATLHACKQGVLDSKPLSPEVLIYIYWAVIYAFKYSVVHRPTELGITGGKICAHKTQNFRDYSKPAKSKSAFNRTPV